VKRITKKKGPRRRVKKERRQDVFIPNGHSARERATDHHRLPQSRVHEFGENPDFYDNVRVVPVRLHKAWHRLFYNLTPAEVIAQLQEEGESVFLTNEKKQKAWGLLFPHFTQLEEVIEVIERFWMGEAVADALGYTFQYYTPPEIDSAELSCFGSLKAT
jgi:hypothetical protein